MTPNEIRKFFDELLDKDLQRHLDKLGTGMAPVQQLGEFVDLAYKNHPQYGESLRQALDILVPHLIHTGETGNDDINDMQNIQSVMDACLFAGHYRQTRDLIYCSFRQQGAVSWTLEGRNLEIKVNDLSFFRQIACERQAFLMNSMNNFPAGLGAQQDKLFAETGYWDMQDERTIELLKLIEIEADIKIAHFFSYIAPDSGVDIGGYAYADFLKVYKSSLVVALYERHWSVIHDTSSVITYPEDALVQMYAANAEISEPVCRQILRDLAVASQGTFNYFPDQQQYLLFPFSYSVLDHIAEMLKQYAKRNEGGFSSGCAPLIGTALVDKVAAYFAQYPNYRVLTEINLQQFDRALPDIDVLAISYEPNFGFQFFICEVKNNLPATWAKEHLKLSDKKGALPKAMSQIGLLQKFLNSPDGARLMFNIVKDAFAHLDFATLFPTGFMGSFNFLVVTPQNIGVLLPSGDTKIVNDDFLRHLIKASDGDSTYLKHYISHLNELLEESYSVVQDTFEMGGYQIRYDVASLKHMIGFEKNEYLSAGLLEQYEQEGLEAGYRYIDTLGLKDKPADPM